MDVRDCRIFRYKRVNLERQAVKLNRVKLEACLTYPLCNNCSTMPPPFLNAYTLLRSHLILFYLAMLSWECIDKKLIDEQLKHCPVCNADLVCSPLDKLRANDLGKLEDLNKTCLRTFIC
ncbi:hypothetical protein AHAS_Ahas13G0291600 [Arachis hypogaea]